MSRHPTPLIFLLLALPIFSLLASCSLMYPEPSAEGEDSNFESKTPDYALRAKEYFEGGNYARARFQLGKYLEKDPKNWMVRLNLHYCDYYLGLQQLRAGNLKEGRDRIRHAEAAMRSMWNGKLAASTDDSKLASVQPWKAAFGIAICQRGLGWADQLEIDRRKRQIAKLSTDDKRRQGIQRGIIDAKKRQQQNYEGAANLLDRLVEMERTSPEAVKNLAELRLSMGQEDEAEKHFIWYLKLADESHDQHKSYKAGEQFGKDFTSERSRKIASSILEEKLESNSEKRVEVLINLGHVQYQKNGYQRALQYLERAQKIQPDRLDILLKMAQCLGEDGQYKSAIARLEEYIGECSQREVRFNEEIARAYRLKASYEHRLKTGGR